MILEFAGSLNGMLQRIEMHLKFKVFEMIHRLNVQRGMLCTLAAADKLDLNDNPLSVLAKQIFLLLSSALSRLSGEPIFELKASHAMDVLWSSRNRMSNLVGNVVNINTGDWVRRDSGVGAGIDSYYEYVAKAYVLLGEEKYLSRWNTHYSAVMKYLGQVN